MLPRTTNFQLASVPGNESRPLRLYVEAKTLRLPNVASKAAFGYRKYPKYQKMPPKILPKPLLIKR
jgi:hypothetical protein